MSAQRDDGIPEEVDCPEQSQDRSTLLAWLRALRSPGVSPPTLPPLPAGTNERITVLFCVVDSDE